MDIWKKSLQFLKYLLVFVTVLILLLELLLLFGGDRLSRWVVDRFNAAQPGEAYVDDMRISLLSGFPSICLRLGAFQYFEREEGRRGAEEKPIMQVNDLRVGINPWRLLASEVRVTELSLDSGYIGLILYPDSSLNILNALGPLGRMAPEDSAQDEPPGDGKFEFVLKNLDLKQLNLRLDDLQHQRGLDLLLERMEHRFAYRSKEIRNDLKLKGQIRNLWSKKGDLLAGYPVALETAFSLDRKNYFADIRRCALSAGGIALSGAGTYDHFDDGMADLEGEATLTNLDLRPLLTLGVLDSAFFTDYLHGVISLNGSVQGKIRSENLPLIKTAFEIDTLHCNNHSGIPLVERINASGSFSNGKAPDLSEAELRLDELDLKLMGGFTRGKFFVENFINPRFEFDLETDQQLSVVEQLITLDPVRDLNGRLKADIDLEGHYNADQPYGLVMRTAEGEVIAEEVSMLVPSRDLNFHRIDAKLSYRDNRLALDTLALAVNNSDLGIRGDLDNFLAYYFGEPVDVTGRLALASKKMQWADFLTDPFLLNYLDPVMSDFYCEMDLIGYGKTRMKGRILPSGQLRFRRLHLKRSQSPDIQRIRGTLGIEPEMMGVKNLTGIIGRSDFNMSAGIRNYHAYVDRTTAQDIVLFFNVDSDNMRAKDFLVVNGQFLAPEQFLDEQLKHFVFEGDFLVNNQELDKQRKVPNSTYRIRTLQFNFSLFPATVWETEMLLHRRDNSLILEKLNSRIGESDLNMNGNLYKRSGGQGNVLSLNDYSFTLNVRSGYLNLDEMMAINLAGNNDAVVETPPRPAAAPDSSISEKEVIIEERLGSYNLFAQDFPDATFTLSIDSLRIYKRKLHGIDGRLTVRPDKTITLEQFILTLGTGSVLMNGSIDASDPELLLMNTQGRLENADLSSISMPFVYDSVSYVISEHFSGTMDAGMDLTIGMTPALDVNLKDVFGTIDFSLRDGAIRDFTPLLILGDFLGDKNLTFVRIDDLENTLTLEDNVLTLPLMDINSTIGHIRMAGFQKVNGEMEYLMQVPLGLLTSAAWNYLTGKERKEDAAPDEIEIGDDATIYISLRIVGTPDDYSIKLGKGKSFREMVREARQERREKRKAGKAENNS